MKYAVVTGVSQGLGESIARLFLESGINVIGISRTNNNKLSKIADETNAEFQHVSCDLAEVKNIELTFDQIKHRISNEASTVYLVNNAAVLEPIDQAMNIDPWELAHHVQVNTIAPMVMMNMFLKQAVNTNTHLVGVIITSGAAERPYYGWSAYCSTKASINMYTKTVALEQDELKTGNKIIAFSPGVMDTSMQEKIRASSSEAFADVETFRNYKNSNLLKDTDTVGRVLVDILTDETMIKNGKIYHIKDYV